eukprot:COSAG06_NODE_3179_length_5724_cov_88.554489_8_plen_85_part_00
MIYQDRLATNTRQVCKEVCPHRCVARPDLQPGLGVAVHKLSAPPLLSDRTAREQQQRRQGKHTKQGKARQDKARRGYVGALAHT